MKRNPLSPLPAFSPLPKGGGPGGRGELRRSLGFTSDEGATCLTVVVFIGLLVIAGYWKFGWTEQGKRMMAAPFVLIGGLFVLAFVTSSVKNLRARSRVRALIAAPDAARARVLADDMTVRGILDSMTELLDAVAAPGPARTGLVHLASHSSTLCKAARARFASVPVEGTSADAADLFPFWDSYREGEDLAATFFVRASGDSSSRERFLAYVIGHYGNDEKAWCARWKPVLAGVTANELRKLAGPEPKWWTARRLDAFERS